MRDILENVERILEENALEFLREMAFGPPVKSSRFEVDRMREEKAAEWRLKGYSKELIELGLKWAEGWATKASKRYGPDEETQDKILVHIYPMALEIAERYIT